MLSVHLLRGIPLAGQEGMTGADNLSLKEGGEVGVILSHGGKRAEMSQMDCKVERGGREMWSASPVVTRPLALYAHMYESKETHGPRNELCSVCHNGYHA